MVEELARWKAALSQKISSGETVMKQCLNDRKVTRTNLLDAYSNLLALKENFDLLNKQPPLKTSNIVDLSLECSNLARGLVVQLLGAKSIQPVDVEHLPVFTEAEYTADYVSFPPSTFLVI